MFNQDVETARLLKVREVATRLRCSETTIRRMLYDGEIEGVKVRGTIRVFPESIDTMLDLRGYRKLICERERSVRRLRDRIMFRRPAPEPSGKSATYRQEPHHGVKPTAE